MDIYLSDADHILSQLAENPDHIERDHLTALATAYALTSIAKSLAEERTLAVVQ